jgi:hypothetical protein
MGAQSADQMTRYLESLTSNEPLAGARARALAEGRTSKRARFARIGNAFLQAAREGFTKQPVANGQGMLSPGGNATPVAPSAIAQGPIAICALEQRTAGAKRLRRGTNWLCRLAHSSPQKES